MNYTISQASLQMRTKNLLLGAFFSLALIVITMAGHSQYPQTYNIVFLWSVIFFVVLGNLVNLYRHMRYLRMVKHHQVKLDGDKILFATDSVKSELEIKDIAMLTFYRRRGEVRHIQLVLKNNRGIRLEGYGGLEQLGEAIADQIPKERVTGRRVLG